MRAVLPPSAIISLVNNNSPSGAENPNASKHSKTGVPNSVNCAEMTAFLQPVRTKSFVTRCPKTALMP